MNDKKELMVLHRIIDECNDRKTTCNSWACIEKEENIIRECREKIRKILLIQKNGQTN